MECARCHRENSPQSNFCGHCGAKLLTQCPQCGEKDIQGKKFCPNCGTHLQLLNLTMAMEDHQTIRAINDLDLEAELELYKREVRSGSTIMTCPHCGVKNRVPRSKINQGARCGKCGRSLPSDSR